MACFDANTADSFVRGQLEPAARARAVSHLASCDMCRRLIVLGVAVGPGLDDEDAEIDASATVQLNEAFTPRARDPGDADPPEESTLGRGTIIGRYTVLELVGRGGVGEVYAAYDPKLDRRVALKLLRTTRLAPGDASEERLVREAQAIAKVSHSNVVTVHDVGTHGDRVFLAMEFIDGATVGGWLEAAPRTRREILDVFLAAARGLGAAHAAGFVHRDFKPHNVMVGGDGAVRVMDFGLVRQLGHDGTLYASLAETVRPTGADTGDVELTRTGDLVGTPRYMAPEQLKNERIDARTDQFSFCVSLYEALYGQRPYDGDTLPVLISNVLAGNVLPPPAKPGVPTWIRRIVLRGLEVDPGRRFPSMRALLAALENDPTARRRRVALGVGVAACSVLVAVGARRLATPPRVDCGGGVDRWAKVWTPGADSARRRAIHSAFVASGKSYAEQVFGGAAAALDGYARGWIGVYEDACVAHARGEQSSEVLDLRMSCLQDRLTAANALTELFTKADGQIVENAVTAAGALPRLERCSDVPLLKAVVPPPEGEALRARVADLRGEVARLAALRDAGHCHEAEALADDLVARVRATGYLPLVADALNAAGHLGDQCADVATTIARFEGAYVAALASRHDEAAAIAAIETAGFHADREHQIAAGRLWLDIAHAILKRLGGRPLLDAWLMNGDGIQAIVEGRPNDAVALYRRSHEARVAILGADHPDTLLAQVNVGEALDLAGRPTEAVIAIEAAATRAARVLGPEHPIVAFALADEAEALTHAHRYAEALRKFERAGEIWRGAGSDPVFVAFSAAGVGLSLLGEGRPDDAIAPLEEALRIRLTKGGGVDRVNESRTMLARALWSRPASRARARSLFTTARDEYLAAGAGARDRAAAAAAWLAAPTSAL